MLTSAIHQPSSIVKAMLGLLLTMFSIGLNARTETADSHLLSQYANLPYFIGQDTGKPSVIINFDNSGSMLNMAYEADRAHDYISSTYAFPFGGCRNQTPDPILPEFLFDPSTLYIGYFDNTARYQYVSGTNHLGETYGFFRASATGRWHGNFLNWLTMRRIDIARWVLTGGRVKHIDPVTYARVPFFINSTTSYYVLQGEVEIRDKNMRRADGSCGLRNDTMEISYSQSELYSPIKNGSVILLSGGTLEFENANTNTHRIHNVQIALAQEPIGLIQQFQDQLNIGAAFHNYDHGLNPKGNHSNTIAKAGIDSSTSGLLIVQGATLYPCFPDYTLANPSNFDHCLKTHTKADPNHVIHAINYIPMVWDKTPLAESIYTIWGYAAQQDYGLGHGPSFYDCKAEHPNGTRYPCYEISNEWDPYYDDDSGEKKMCKPTYVITVTDGGATRDFESHLARPNFNHPLPIKTLNGSPPTDPVNAPDISDFGADEALDELAFSSRHHDCRPDGSDLDLNQSLSHIFIYTALGTSTKSSDNDTRRLQEAAMAGGFNDLNGDLLPNPPKLDAIPGNPTPTFREYYQHGLDNPASVIMSDPPVYYTPCNIHPEWDSDGDCSPDNFFYATDGEELKDSLMEAFNAILGQNVSASANFSVSSSSQSSAGTIVQAGMRPSVSFVDTSTNQVQAVSWVGDVFAQFIDENGFLRSDHNNNQILDDTDPMVFTCSTLNLNAIQTKAKLVPLGGMIPTLEDTIACHDSIFDKTREDIVPAWSAHEALSMATNDSSTVQRSYTNSHSLQRYMIMGWDGYSSGLGSDDLDGHIKSNEVIPFLPNNPLFARDNHTFFNFAISGLPTRRMMHWVRGNTRASDNGPIARNRTVNGETFRLGDIISSTPVSVSLASENIDSIYSHLPQGDSYREFRNIYYNRRNVVYAADAQGMIHAFNGGYFDRSSQQLYDNPPGTGLSMPLGKELWAYLPYNVLPFLDTVSRRSYNLFPRRHVSLINGHIKVFDAQIFQASGRAGVTGQTGSAPGGGDLHPNGWGTLLVVGMEFGGGHVTMRSTGARFPERSTGSAYIIFDITHPEYPPVPLLEFTDPDLGFTTSKPTVISVAQTSGDTTDHDHYLLLGSGPFNSPQGLEHAAPLPSLGNSNAKLFVIDLKALDGNDYLKTFGGNNYLELTDSGPSFIGNMTSIDYDLDHSTDAVYFGTQRLVGDLQSRPEENQWDGDLYRISITPDTQPSSFSARKIFSNLGGPVTAAPMVGIDNAFNRQLLVGTGRLFNSGDLVDVHGNNQHMHRFYGLKEPRDDTTGLFTLEAITKPIIDVTNVEVIQGTGALRQPVSIVGQTITTFEQLDEQMQKTRSNNSSTDPLVGGWVRNIPGKIFGGGALLGHKITFTSFVPSEQAQCIFSGQSYLWHLHAATGTSADSGPFGHTQSGNPNSNTVNVSTSIGITPTASVGVRYNPVTHQVTATLQRGDAGITKVEVGTTQTLRSRTANSGSH